MSQDKVADALNQMMNAKKAKKDSVTLKYSSKLLLSILAIAKLRGYVQDYEVANSILTIKFAKLNGCNAIKPRYHVKVYEIEKYTKRYLPSKDLGIVIVSTNQGIMTHQTAMEKNLGGGLLAYFY